MLLQCCLYMDWLKNSALFVRYKIQMFLCYKQSESFEDFEAKELCHRGWWRTCFFEERAAKRRFSTFLQPLCKTLYFAAVLRRLASWRQSCPSLKNLRPPPLMLYKKFHNLVCVTQNAYQEQLKDLLKQFAQIQSKSLTSILLFVPFFSLSGH